MNISGVKNSVCQIVFNKYLQKINFAKFEKESNAEIEIKVKLKKLDKKVNFFPQKPIYYSGNDLYGIRFDYKLLIHNLEFAKKELTNGFNAENTESLKENSGKNSSVDISTFKKTMDATLSYINNSYGKNISGDTLEQNAILLNESKNKALNAEDISKLNKELDKFMPRLKTWQEYQQSFSSCVDDLTNHGIGLSTFKYALKKGYLDDGEEVEKMMTENVRTYINNGESDNWLYLNADSLGLNNTFKNKKEYIKAIDDAISTVNKYNNALTKTLKELPEKDWCSNGGCLNIDA